MSTPPALVVVGDLCPDIVVTGVPTDGRSLRFGQAEDLVAATTLTLGSSAGITACAAAVAGAAVRLLAVVGDDDLGRACTRWLRDRGVDTTEVVVDPDVPTGSSVILVRADEPGDRQILTHLGAMGALRPDHVGDALLREADHVHVSSFFLHTGAREGLPARMLRARALGLTVSLDTNDDPDRRWDDGARAAVAASDLLFCNDDEALGLAGAATGSPVAAAVRVLLSRLSATADDDRLPAVVHKRGRAGARVVTRRGAVDVAAPEVTVVDTVGAGDTLAGTALAALLTGADWPEALSLAVAAGSLSTTGAGGVTAQPDPPTTAALAATLEVTDDRTPTPERRP